MAVKREKIHFETLEELLGAPVHDEDGSTVEIKVDQIHPFLHHPFKVIDDERMEQLIQSIKDHGVLIPVLVRPYDDGGYEMISGHRRLHAAKLAGLKTIPAIIRPMNNDDATIAMVDANVQREEILPSERAFSLKMKLDALKRQGARADLERKKIEAAKVGMEYPAYVKEHPIRNGYEILDEVTSGNDCQKLESNQDHYGPNGLSAVDTRELIGRQFGLKGRQVQNYIRLTELLPDILDLVDYKKIAMTLATEISYFPKDVQQWIYEYYRDNHILKKQQLAAIREYPYQDKLTQMLVINLMNGAFEGSRTKKRFWLSERRLNEYFPKSYTIEQKEELIFQLLDEWKKGCADS